ncbi:hypothetical protein GCM10008986_16870 [Salinibacillus aidingensis]|uniref:Tail spike domain-containing protein n=1 Tax=Salinibacillus aidingensis TaxID=237684 RepID=A0ABP3L3U1_9BACI
MFNRTYNFVYNSTKLDAAVKSVTVTKSIVKSRMIIRNNVTSNTHTKTDANGSVKVIRKTGDTISVVNTDSFVKGVIGVTSSLTTKATTMTILDNSIRNYAPSIPYKKSEPSPIWIYDRNEQLKTVLMPKQQHKRKAVPYWNGWYVEQLNGKVTLDFETVSDIPESEFIEPDGRAVIRDMDGNLVEFIIRSPEDVDDRNGTVKVVYAEGGMYELIDEWLSGYTAANVDPETALRAILQGTRWEVGHVDTFDNQSVDFEDITVKEAVHELANMFSGELRYRVEADHNTITRRYVDLLQKRGKRTMKRWEMGKDVESYRRTVDTTGIKTALYAKGKSTKNDGPRVTFADVEWSKAKGDPVDKPLGDIYVADPEALHQWGYDGGTRHRKGFYDGQEGDPATLLLNAWKELQKQKDAVYTYDFNVLLLEKLTGYSHEKVRLGDTNAAINHRVHPKSEVETSVIEFRQNLNDETLSEVTLGAFRRQFDTNSRVRNVEKGYNRNKGKWDEKETPEGAQSKADQALATAREEIDAAEQRISQAETDISSAQSIIDEVTSEDSSGQHVLNGTLITNEIIAENATLTGTLTGSNATILNLTTDNMTAKNATIQDATITGDFVSGSINIGEDATVGQNLTIGNNESTGSWYSASYLSFGDYANIYASSTGDMSFNADSLNIYSNDIVLPQIVESYPNGTDFNGGFFFSQISFQGIDNNNRIYTDTADNQRMKLETDDTTNKTQIWVDPARTNVYFLVNDIVNHTFYGSGNKDGGSIEIDGIRYGMSPIDSPQTLIFDLITDIQVNGETKIYLDSILSKALENFAVFPNNPDVKVIQKGTDYFVVDGIGLADFQVIGNRIGFEDAYFTNLTKMSEDLQAKESLNG